MMASKKNLLDTRRQRQRENRRKKSREVLSICFVGGTYVNCKSDIFCIALCKTIDIK